MKKILQNNGTFENKVLVVEDDRSILDALQMALEYNGYQVAVSR
jgi:DNA-binding response OmpR family regulator